MTPQIYQFYWLSKPQVEYPTHLGIHTRRLSDKRSHPTYGHALYAAHLESRSQRGIIVLEQDIAIDPEIIAELTDHTNQCREIVVAIPYRLYPKSTGLDTVVWAHRINSSNGQPLFVPATEECPRKPAYFGLGCTFLPSVLLEKMPEDLSQWDYPRLDSLLSMLAREHKIPCLTTNRAAVHIHY